MVLHQCSLIQKQYCRLQLNAYAEHFKLVCMKVVDRLVNESWKDTVPSAPEM